MKVLIVLLSLLTIPFAHSGALLGTYGVEVVAVDGVAIKHSFFSDRELTLADGEHQVVVIYDKNFQNSERVTSKPHIFNIDVKGYTEIRVKHFNNAPTAQHTVKKGLTWIVKNEEKTKKIANSDTVYGEGFLPNKNIEKLIAAYNQEHAISIVTSAPVVLPTTTIVTSTQSTVKTPELIVSDISSVANDKSNTEHLIQLYNAANKEERRAFRMWLLEQDMK